MRFAFSSRRRRRLSIEPLEARRVLSAMPLGALPEDTAEYMLGRVAVTPVFLESDGTIDASTEDWTEAEAAGVLAKIEEGLQWWTDALAAQGSVHTLEFVVDDAFATRPFEVPYEGISRPSDDYALYASAFLDSRGFSSGSLSSRARQFNHAQRIAHQTDWAFTMFVVDAENDLDGSFASGGSFSRAFAFAGGLFMVAPSTRPASTFAHETGHLFWARDEYPGGGSWTDQRGYYNTQNENAADNPTDGFVQQPSIMAAGAALEAAWENHISAASSLAMVGWQDSDGDGIFDVLDVPLELEGSGRYIPSEGAVRFSGSATAVPLVNRNPSGLQSDVTLNRVSRIEYQIDDGSWQTITTPDRQRVDLELTIPIDSAFEVVRVRAVDAATGVTSRAAEIPASHAGRTVASGVGGYAWWDRNADGIWDEGELPLGGISLELADAGGEPLSLSVPLVPEEMEDGVLPEAGIDGVRLIAEGLFDDFQVGVVPVEEGSPGEKTFAYFDPEASLWKTEWGGDVALNWNAPEVTQLRGEFDVPTTVVHAEVKGIEASYGRLSAFDRHGNLLGRATTERLAAGESQTLRVADPEGRIAWVRISGHGGSSFALERFAYGPRVVMRSDPHGTFAADFLPDGTYTVHAPELPAGLRWESEPAQIEVVQGRAERFAAIEAVGGLWTNPVDAVDIDGDSRVQPIDALLVINALNRGGMRALTPSDIGPPYYDSDADGQLAPRDALLVVNRLNASSRGDGELLAAAGSADPVGGAERDAEAEGERGSEAALGSPLEQVIEALATDPTRLQQIARMPREMDPPEAAEEGSARPQRLDEFFLEPFSSQPF